MNLKDKNKKNGILRLLEIAGTKKWWLFASMALAVIATLAQFVPVVSVYLIIEELAAHAADIAKGVKAAAQRDLEMSLARKRLDWGAQEKLSLQPELSRRVHHKHDTSGDACSMCGEYCAMRLVEDYLGVSAERC